MNQKKTAEKKPVKKNLPQKKETSNQSSLKIPPTSKIDREVPKEPVVGFVHSQMLSDLFRQLKISLLVSTYQAQRICLFTVKQDRLSMLMRSFERPTGIAYDGKHLALCTKRQVWFFEKTFNVHSPEGARLDADVCFVPRKSYVTGDVAAHEAGFLNEKFFFMNTRFSCIATVSDDFSFESLWKPSFISQLAPEDRCHINGMAFDQAGIKYVSALGHSDKAEGWVANKKNGGILIDVSSDEIISQGFCMPHSPRLYDNKLWILNSGIGELQTIDLKTGKAISVCQFPGYCRGLAFAGRYAFVGLCKIRESEIFGGIPISEKGFELKSGVSVVDIDRGTIVGFIDFTKGIEELFDVTIIPDYTSPEIIGFEEDTIDGLYVLP
jgi:uncharacterized protein (TIGR03032 family)